MPERAVHSKAELAVAGDLRKEATDTWQVRRQAARLQGLGLHQADTLRDLGNAGDGNIG